MMITACSHDYKRRGKGFSLVEVLLASLILGISFTAILFSIGSSTKVSRESATITEGVFFAHEIREWTMNLPFVDPDPGDQGKPPGPDSYQGDDPYVDDLDDLLDATFSPPRNSFGEAFDGQDQWSQTITLTWLAEDDLDSIQPDGSTDIIRVEVVVHNSGVEMHRARWLVTRKE